MKPEASLSKKLSIYFAGTIVAYLASLAVFWPRNGQEEPSTLIFLFLMFAPTIGAIAARLFTGAKIQFGRPNKWIFAGLLPAIVVLGVYLVGSAFGLNTENPGLLITALSLSAFSIFSASFSAIGEEIGWRGFMWPTIRQHWSFPKATLFTFGIWWLYHVPLILLGWYGSLSGLLAFTVAIAGITVFIGAITDRSKSLWPSVITHGAWNGLVATSFAVTEGDGTVVPAFAGSENLMGEFGWLAAIGALIVGVATYVWHMRYLQNHEPNS